MLSTDSKLTSLLVWLAIAAIVTNAAWTFFTWPAPDALLSRLLDSDLAAFAHRNQTIVAGLLGAGSLALAYVLNGWRDRTERRHVFERAERRDGAVLAREAKELAAACEAAARHLTVRGAPPAGVVAELKIAVAPGDHMLLAVPVADFARLGAGASSAARVVRHTMRRLTEVLETSTKDDVAGTRNISARAMEAALAARNAAPVFEALASAGPKAADRIRMQASPEAGDSDRLIAYDDEAARASRLLPAA